MAYETLKDLVAAVQSGELDLERHSPLLIDNDNTNIYPLPPEGLSDEEEDAWLEAHGSAVFSMHPADLLDEAVELLGIPCEGV